MSRSKMSFCLAVGFGAFLLLGAAPDAAAQPGGEDPFVGTWVLNPALSWQFRGEQNKYEIIRISVEDGVQTYRVQSMGARSNVDSQSGLQLEVQRRRVGPLPELHSGQLPRPGAADDLG